MSPEALVARVFGVIPNQIGETTSNRTLPEWDSLGHMMLILELEQAYGLSLSPEEAMELTSVAAIKQALRDRGVSW